MSRNERLIGGHLHLRRFAYLHKRHHDQFGLLEAVDYRNAIQHLGRGYFVRQTWLTIDEHQSQQVDRNRRWEIVASVFKVSQ